MSAQPETLHALLRFYEEERAASRHQDTIRTSVVNVLLTLDSAIIGILAYLVSVGPKAENLAIGFYASGALFVVFGLLGIGLVEKHHERARLHAHRGDRLRERIDALVPEARIMLSLREGERGHSDAIGANARWIERLSLSGLWGAVHTVVVAGGLAAIWIGLHVQPVADWIQWTYAAGAAVASGVLVRAWRRHRLVPKSRAKLRARDESEAREESA